MQLLKVKCLLTRTTCATLLWNNLFAIKWKLRQISQSKSLTKCKAFSSNGVLIDSIPKVTHFIKTLGARIFIHMRFCMHICIFTTWMRVFIKHTYTSSHLYSPRSVVYLLFQIPLNHLKYDIKINFIRGSICAPYFNRQKHEFHFSLINAKQLVGKVKLLPLCKRKEILISIIIMIKMHILI